VAHERPTASDVPRPRLTSLDDGVRDTDQLRLTRAQAHALRRSAPLTHANLQEHFKVLMAAGPRVADAQDRDASDRPSLPTLSQRTPRVL
jgi:hypothetical protein